MSMTSGIKKPSSVSAKAEVMPKTFGDINSAAYNQTLLNFNMNSRMEAKEQAKAFQAEQYKNATGNDISDVTNSQEYRDYMGDVPLTNGGKRAKARKDSIQEVLNIIKQDPTNAIKLGKVPTGDELDEKAKEIANLSNQEMEEAMYHSNSNWGGTAEFLGGGGASMTDPFNVATMLVGASTGGSVFQFVAKEAAIGGVTETLTQPNIMEWQEQLGQEYGYKDAAFAIAASTVFSGLLAGGIQVGKAAVGKGVDSALDNITFDNLDKSLSDYVEAGQLKIAEDAAIESSKRFDGVDGGGYSYSNNPTGVPTLTTMADIADAGNMNPNISFDIRMEVRDHLYNASMPANKPTPLDMQSHSGNMVSTIRSFETGSIRNIPLERIAWERFTAIDDNAHVKFVEDANTQGIDLKDPVAMDAFITGKIREGLEEEAVLLAGKTLSPKELKSMKARIKQLQDELYSLDDLDTSPYSTGKVGKRKSSNDGDMRKVEKESTDFVEDRQRTIKQVAELKSAVRESVKNHNKMNELKRAASGKKIGDSIRPMYDQIANNMRRLDAETKANNATSVELNSSDFKFFEDFADMQAKPVARTPKEIQEGLEIAKGADPKAVNKAIMDEIDEMPDTMRSYDNEGNSVSVVELRKSWKDSDEVSNIMGLCSIGGK